VGAGFRPRKSSPEGLSHMMMEQQADRGGRFLLFSVLNSGKSFLQMFDVPFFMQEAIICWKYTMKMRYGLLFKYSSNFIIGVIETAKSCTMIHHFPFAAFSQMLSEERKPFPLFFPLLKFFIVKREYLDFIMT
jgi:hypothetical protein